MKHLNNIIIVNWWFIGLMALLYLTIWFGALLHITLGIFHLTLYVMLLYKFTSFPQVIKGLLLLYGVLTVIVLSAPFIFLPRELYFYAWVATFPLAGFFTIILYKIKNLIV